MAVLRQLGRLLCGGGPLNIIENLRIFPKALWLARLARREAVDHIHSHWASTNATTAMIAGELTGIPWSYTAHRADIVLNNLLKRKTESALFGRYISKSGLRMAVELCPDLPEHKTVVVHMGVVSRAAASAAPPVESSARPIFVCPARLEDVKGHKYLVEAVAILRQRGVAVDVRFAGEGPLRRKLERHVNQLKLSESIRLLGHVSHDELMRLYDSGRLTAVVLPSVLLRKHLHEGVPVSLMEAMDHRVPVISTTTGGIVELLEGDAGILVPPADATALADAIERLIREPDLRRRLADAGHARIIEAWAVESIAGRLCELFERGLGPFPSTDRDPGATAAAPPESPWTP